MCATRHSSIEPQRTLDIHVRGAVQGVGFRPHVYRIASQHGIDGWVRNDGQGVHICATGTATILDRFVNDLKQKAPAASRIQSVDIADGAAPVASGFQIVESKTDDAPQAAITPDLATCPDCLRELRDPSNRRHRYPFINCTQCGPRFSIVQGIPYDRPHTTMRAFTMCRACKAEYDDPANRRFHAQPNACPDCGPHLAWTTPAGSITATRDDALAAAVDAICAGRIVAVKGLGGFHLMVDATNNDAIERLRERKGRDEKPFAVMCPSLERARALCEVSDLEGELLTSVAAPIVLLKNVSPLAPAVAPDNPLLGVMLPYTPLHHVLMAALNRPVVATSGNRSDEPICIDNDEALDRLRDIADGFLLHDRPIARPIDDSVVRVMAGRPLLLRRARGYAPSPVPLPRPVPSPLLAVGAHLKNTVALAHADCAVISQHLGDLDTEPATRAFEDAVQTLTGLYRAEPRCVVCDLHPDYASTRFAERITNEPIRVQHHHAHVAACMLDNELAGPVLGVAWDGTGYGPDGTIWGGEFLLADYSTYTRVAHFRTFPLPGGDAAIREPARVALGLLFELYGEEAFAMTDLPPLQALSGDVQRTLRHMLVQQINTPLTSSAGRLFDAAASLLGIRHRSAFEGQAAMQLEFTADGAASPSPCLRLGGTPRPTRCDMSESRKGRARRSAEPSGIIDWAPLFTRLVDGVRANESPAELAACFHDTMAACIAEVAAQAGQERVLLSGGCFQNKRLLERTIDALCEKGYSPFWHKGVPTNDGGISLGQAAVAAHVEQG